MAPRTTQSNTALNAAIFFAVVFIAATVLAIVYYLKAEDNKKLYETALADSQEIARGREKNEVGQAVKGESYLGTMLSYFNQFSDKIGGVQTADATAEVKFNETLTALEATYKELMLSEFDPNGLSLIRIASLLNQARISAIELAMEKQTLVDQMTAKLDDLQQGHLDSEKTWQQELEGQKNIADASQKRYENLQALIDEKFGEQIGSLTKKLAETRTQLQEKDNELLKTQAELGQTEKRMNHYLGVIESIKPQPMKEVKAFKPDGEIVSADPASGIIIINLGSDDHVYPGLTFAVYNKNAPIPPDGKGKAELEVFSVEKRISLARIKPESVDPKQSIIAQDPIANLIWDADAVNTFVISGDFDIEGDGKRDADGIEKVRQMINSWGGQVSDEVTIKTDFIVLGTAPFVPSKPGIEDIDLDPTATEKYEKALAEQDRYQQVIEKARTFSIPVFDIKRFKYFIGQGK